MSSDGSSGGGISQTAGAAGTEIIDPRNTRFLLCEFIEEAQKVIITQLGPPSAPYSP
jgi:methylmalonyl-CoA decarboxylase subunit alpha